MRFPNTPFMKRTFDLFKRLNVKLIDYIFNNTATRDYYPYDADGYVPQSYYKEGTVAIVDSVLDPFRELFARNPIAEAVTQLMQFDAYSTRSWMTVTVPFSGSNTTRHDSLPDPMGIQIAAQRKIYPSSVVNWVETHDTSTGSYDRALTEAVFESIAFHYPLAGNGSESGRWFCVE